MQLIDADKLIEKLSANLDNPEELPVISIGTVMRMIDIEAEIHTSQQEQKWIPCSERLPRQGQEVICQCRANMIRVLKLNVDGDWYQDADHCYMGGFVIAWMPLPEEPYKERRKADSCEGCKNIGLWENEYEYGVSCPCFRCVRRAEDNYEPERRTDAAE